MKDANSSTNQKIKGQFVDREVICLFSYPFEACLKAGSDGVEDMPSYDEIENLYTYPEYRGKHIDFRGGTSNKYEAEIKHWEELRDSYMDDGATKTGNEIHKDLHEFIELETEPQEIYEWWIVTDYLYEKLKEHGEPVIEWQNLYIWGRTTTGQAILLDSVITKICSEMEILEGQRYTWAEKQTV